MARRRGPLLDDDFGPAIAALKEASGLTWSQLARLLGTSTVNLWRWRNGVRPNADHLLDLQALASASNRFCPRCASMRALGSEP